MRVFISSTYLDNKNRRATVQEAILRAEMMPIGMERFPASATPTVEDCLLRVRSCDIFVGIVAERYGWISDGHELSISELEYDAAKERGLPRLIFEIEADDGATGASDQPQKLDAFRAKLRADQRPARCGENELGMVVLQSLTSLQSEGVARSTPTDSISRDIAANLYRLRCSACEELDRSAAILTNLPLSLSHSEAERREEAARRLREIGVQLSNVGDVSEDALRRHLGELRVPDAASMRKAGRVFIFLSNNTTLCFQPMIADQHANERENQIAREEARRLLHCPRS